MLLHWFVVVTVFLMDLSDSHEQKFSSWECTGGNQHFEMESDILFQQTPISLTNLRNRNKKEKVPQEACPTATNDIFRSCHFENVCLVNGKLTFYQEPNVADYLRKTAPYLLMEYQRPFPLGFWYTYAEQNHDGNDWLPQIVESAIPEDMAWGDKSVYLFDAISAADNYGPPPHPHILISPLLTHPHNTLPDKPSYLPSPTPSYFPS